MSEVYSGCTVAPYTKCNSATSCFRNATENATNNATNDLLALSVRVLERNQRNRPCNSSATNQLHGDATKATNTNQLHEHATNQTRMVNTFSHKSCNVACCKERNSATQEIRSLIEQISKNYGGDDADFLSAYIDDVIREWSHDLDAVRRCFVDLITLIPVKNRQKQEVI